MRRHLTLVRAHDGGPPASIAPRLLKVWIVVQAAAAAIALFAVATTMSIQPAIALTWPGLQPADAIAAGLTFWLAFGLVGGIRTRLQPGGGVVTFSMPFIVAGTVLGGPLVGGLMGLVSELEVRELRTRPWYGVISNHTVGILAAVGAGIISLQLRARLDQLLPGQEQLTFFAAVMVAALVFATVNVLLVIPTLALRNDLSIEEASRTPDAAFRVTTVAEAIVAWNLAMAYQSVGWWAPIVIVGLVLAVWQAFDLGEARLHDPMTRLLNDLGFHPRLVKALEAARLGRRSSALLLIDLDRFKDVNDTYLHPAGDEVIVAIAGRLLAAVRATDAVVRLHRAGDEFVLLLDSVVDLHTARRLAERVQRRIMEPVHLRTRAAVVTVGASIGGVLLDPSLDLDADGVLALAGARMLEAKRPPGSGIVLEGEDDEAALQARRAAGPRRPPVSDPEPLPNPPSAAY